MLEKVTYASRDIAGILAGVEHQYRVEVRIGNGDSQYFALKACTRAEALTEANEVAMLIAAAKNSTVLFRLPHGMWTVAGGTVKAKMTLKERFRKIANEFFLIDEEE